MKTELTHRLLILSLCLSLAACQAALPGLSTPTPSPPTPTPQPFAIAPSSARSNLERLNSYRANLIIDFAGTRGDQPASGRIESLTEVNRPANALRHYLNINADIPNLPDSRGIAQFFKIGNQVYVSRNGEAFQFEAGNASLSPGNVGLFELDSFIIIPPTVPNAPSIEKIEGQNALHYRFDQNDVSHPNFSINQAQGDVWVAVPDNYLLQYVISATLRVVAPLPNAPILDQGQLNLSYKLTDINADIVITPPENVTPGRTPFAGFPPPPESQITAIYPTLIEYTSVISPISATLFYQTGLPATGWSEEAAEIFEEKSRLIYSKDSQRLTVLITPTDDPRKIKIVLDIDQ